MCVAQGMLLDLDAATLTVWVNGERKGVMVRPGMTCDYNGRSVRRLEGPLHWAVDLVASHQATADSSVAVAGPLPPPVVTAEDLAADGASSAEDDETSDGE